MKKAVKLPAIETPKDFFEKLETFLRENGVRNLWVVHNDIGNEMVGIVTSRESYYIRYAKPVGLVVTCYTPEDIVIKNGKRV